MDINIKPVANPIVVLREEFDDWAILFDPDTGRAYGMNPISVLVWKMLDGEHSVEEIIKEVGKSCKNVPEEVGRDVESFIEDMLEKGLAGIEAKG